jgi:hypothetical protein
VAFADSSSLGPAGLLGIVEGFGYSVDSIAAAAGRDWVVDKAEVPGRGRPPQLTLISIRPPLALMSLL